MSALRDTFANTQAALVLVLVVVAVSANGYRAAGFVAAASAAVWFDVFLTVPYGHLSITDRDDVETTLLLLGVGFAVTEIAVWGRRKASLAAQQAGYLAGIGQATERASQGSSIAVHEVSDQLVQLLGLSACRFDPGVAGVGSPAKLRHDGEVERERAVWDVQGRGLPVDVDIELLVETGGRLKGRFLMHANPGSRPTLAQRQVAVTLAGQVATIP
jgi:K+-sensing histidine kinase KdpD